MIIFFVLSLFLLPMVLASSVDDELQKVTYYAEDYEVGNINYVQLMVYLSSVRESLNEELVVGKMSMDEFNCGKF